MYHQTNPQNSIEKIRTQSQIDLEIEELLIKLEPKPNATH